MPIIAESQQAAPVKMIVLARFIAASILKVSNESLYVQRFRSTAPAEISRSNAFAAAPKRAVS